MEWHFDERINAAVIIVLDSTGIAFDPASCSHVYVYNGDSTLATDTATDPLTSIVRLKTYTYTSGNLVTESAWIKQ